MIAIPAVGTTVISGPARPFADSRSDRRTRTVRSSRYLNAVDLGDGNSLLYNGLSMCIDSVPSEIARRLVSPGEAGDLSFLMPVEKEYLVKRGHLTELTTEDEQEEMGRLARAIAEKDAESNVHRFREKTVTFVLTYRCNLSCAYCYQSEIRKTSGLSSMSEAFVDDFFGRHMGELLPHEREKLSFSLYGGEPLLPANRPAIERILQYAKEHGSVVSTVTNGVMLPEMLDLIGPERGKINNVQVTLDGGRTFHDSKRVSQSGGPTFEQTILALREIVRTRANAIVRVHLHPHSLESARSLLEYLEEEKFLGHHRVKLYFWSTEDLYAGVLSSPEYALLLKLFEDVTMKQDSVPTAHFAFLEQIMNMDTPTSRPARRHCDICVAGLHCVVDSAGDVYECIDDAGHKDRRIAGLAAGEVEYFEPNKDREKLHLCDKPECLKCSVALFCGGGCINRLKAQSESQSGTFCEQVKEFVGLTLRCHYLLKKSGVSTN
jgi:uncharacterized protein